MRIVLVLALAFVALTPRSGESVECVQVGASIQDAIDANAGGTTFCLSGSFMVDTPIYPKDGDVFLGPADLSGTAESGFDMKEVAATGVTLEGLTLHGFGLRGVNCWVGTTVLDSEFYGNGRNAIGCGLQGQADILVQGNYIHDNGSPNELGRGASGMKFVLGSGIRIRDNRVIHNMGNGIWCDLGCGKFTVTGNTVRANSRKGIFVETSYGPALIANNVVKGNNCSPRFWDAYPDCPMRNPEAHPGTGYGPQKAEVGGSGIGAMSSMYVTIRDNVLRNNQVAGINVQDDGRLYDAPFVIVLSRNVLNGEPLLRGDLGG